MKRKKKRKHIKLSMRQRLTLITVGMILMCIVCSYTMNLFILPVFYQHTKIRQMNELYARANAVFEGKDWEGLSEDEKDTVFEEMEKLESVGGAQIYVMSVRLNTDTKTISSVNYLYPALTARDEALNLMQLEEYVIYRQTGQISPNHKLLAATENYNLFMAKDSRIETNYMELVGGITGDAWIFIRSDYQRIKESAKVSNAMLFYVGLFVMLLGAIVMVIVSKSYTKPLNQLTQIAKKMEKMNFSVRYQGDRTDEIGELGRSMNAMSDELERTISELKTANKELKKDIRNREEQERMRQEFLANVSHELKTPLALIQGYAEGLQDNVFDDEESKKFYCDVIIDESKKMDQMVRRLLTLNELEFGENNISLSHFNLTELVKGVVTSSGILFEQKQVQIRFQERKEYMVWADQGKIEEVLMNYISNACNHAEGEKIIEVKIIPHGDKARVSVFNTGKTIPEEDLDQIWNKFYKVDKARTRAYGGNGIGLSIVRAIMEAHGEAYGVENYDNGVAFWFELDESMNGEQ